MKIKYLFFSKVFFPFAMAYTLISCSDFIDIDPPETQIVSEHVYNDEATAEAAIRGIYNQLINGATFASGGAASITVLCGLSADEFINYASDLNRTEFYNNTLQATNGMVNSSFWTPAYRFIYFANAILEGLRTTSGISPDVKDRLEGEARFIRAFCNFYLVNLFGEIPLVEGTDYRRNNTLPRSPVPNVYNFITSDLLRAKDLLPDAYHTPERVRPNRWAATALLARVYLYQEKWVEAEQQASEVISKSEYFELADDVNVIFLKNSREAIWQLMPVSTTFNTNEGSLFILTSNPAWVSLTGQLVNAFEPGDKRYANWIRSITTNGRTYFYPFKYKIRTGTPLNEYSMVLRLAEQYLIRAEARMHLDNATGSLSDLNSIRNRAGLGNINTGDKAEILQAIIKERQVELFSEWGHRWFDLKRTKYIGNTLRPVKSDWQDTDALYPIPQSERALNTNLSQNEGYY